MSIDTVNGHNRPVSGNFNPSDIANTFPTINNEVYDSLDTQLSAVSTADDSCQLSSSTNMTSSHNISFPQMSADTVSCHNCLFSGNFNLSRCRKYFSYHI